MRFEKGNTPWNKGLKYGKYDEPSAKRLRRNEEYYKKELKNNALRSKREGYNNDRYEEITLQHKKRRDEVGYFKPRRWSKAEIEYLFENKGKNYSEIAKHLGRSLSSVEHKMARLGLQKYNKWTN